MTGARYSSAVPSVRITHQVQQVLRAFLANERELYGLEIANHTGLLTGTTYTILRRLEEVGWISGRWEDSDARSGQPRHLYQLTDVGRDAVPQALRTARVLRFPRVVGGASPECESRPGSR